jgi:UDP-N-acetylmuramyl pentapeptide phosphotransferase/UDP-N-acetylglucosamine-1-phosphate transferase
MADFDGLSPGNGILMTLGLLLVYSFSHKDTSVFILMALLPTLLVLWKYNHFPSKLFLGDSGTLFIGAILGVSAVGANRELAVVLMFVPYGIHLLLQTLYAFDQGNWFARPRERAIPQKNGTIKSEYKRPYGLTHWVMQTLPRCTESSLVYSLMTIELLFIILAVYLELPHLQIAASGIR